MAYNFPPASTVLTSHESAVNPHPNYMTTAAGDSRYALAGGTVNGSATLFHEMAMARGDCLSYWRCNEASGNLLDMAPGARHGTLSGAATRAQPSLSVYPSDSSCLFTGAGHFVLGAALGFARTDVWSVEFLVTPNVSASGIYTVVSKRLVAGTGWDVNLEAVTATTSRVVGFLCNTYPSDAILVKSSEVLTNGQTYHVCVTMEPAGRGLSLAAASFQLPMIRIWINGREQALSGAAEVRPYLTISGTLANAADAVIGALVDGTRRFSGSLDEIAIYSGAVEPSYIQRRASLALSGKPRSLPAAVAAPPRNVILDFDINTDCDDFGDLHQMLALKSRGDVNLLGLIVSTKSNTSAPAASAVLEYWDEASTVPVGAYQGSLGVGTDAGVSGPVRDQFKPGVTRSGYTDDLVQYRTLLQSAADSSVTIVATGFAISLKRLQDSPADGISPLTGAQLIARKVGLLILIGNVYPYNATADVEYNAASDPASWKQVIETWPTPLVLSGGELGEFIRTAPPTNRGDLLTNPTRFAYNNFAGTGTRQSWGQLGTAFIVSPGLFALSEPFTQTVSATTGQATAPVYSPTATRYFLRFAEKGGETVRALLNSLLLPVPVIKGALRTAQFTVAGLPGAGSAGRVAFATNGRKISEGVGAGTGVLCYDDGVAWRRVSDDSTVAA